MLMKRIVSTFLAALMLIGSLALTVSAADEAADGAVTGPVYEYNTSKASPTMNYLTGEYKPSEDAEAVIIKTEQQKLDTMDLRLEQNGYRLYVDEYSGEVAVECIATGDVMFSNPYDVSTRANLDDKTKPEKLSQIIIDYFDTSTSTTGSYNSYTHAAKGGDIKTENASQITVKYIKNGLRVEYSIGRVNTRYLVPERMLADDFEYEIKDKIDEAVAALDENIKELEGVADDEIIDGLRQDRLLANTVLKWFRRYEDVDTYLENKGFTVEKIGEEKSKEQREKYTTLHPETAYGAVYEFTTTIPNEYAKAEKVIKQYCPDFTYEMLDEAHLALGYTPDEQNQPLFNVALEYTINEDGFSVRLPANGIRFDESIYRLENIQILPYMGAGMNHNSGYTFFPDGSGALFDFETLAKKTTASTFYGNVYGLDYAYYNLSTVAPHNEIIRYPVYGLKEDVVDEQGNEQTRGFLAIIEEGDTMMGITLTHSPKDYNYISLNVNPRPYDQYELSKTGGGDSVWTVISPRKYTGNFKIRYIMLNDPDVAPGYEPTYVGMAKAYRKYLENKGELTRLTAEDVKSDIPLYIETFGAIETTEKFLSIPYDTMKALTSFEDIRTIYDQLAGLGISNVNFVLTGYTKGGLNVDQVPYYLNWDGAVEKQVKFDELVAYAREKGFGVYPDFDFAFVSTNKLFDGLTLDDHAVKTVDDRYISKREYSATRQTYVSYFELAMSPAYFNRFYTKLTEKYKKNNPVGIAVTSLGQYLNSDFDEDEPYHREDSKEFTQEAFKFFDENYEKVLTAGGNAYSWKYVDYITDISTDSSRNVNSYATVPFLGIVLHGYVQTAGEAINMEGNIDYAFLRSVENGAALKFILSYRNTAKLKEYSSTSKYYSVRYDIWQSELVERYNELNELLKTVQLATIDSHEFIAGVRVPDSDEILLDYETALQKAMQEEIDVAVNAKEEYRLKAQSIRKYLLDLEVKLPVAYEPAKAAYDAGVLAAKTTLEEAIADIKLKQAALDLAQETLNANPEDAAAENAYSTASNDFSSSMTNLKNAYAFYSSSVISVYESTKKEQEDYTAKYNFAKDNFQMLVTDNIYSATERARLSEILESLVDEEVAFKGLVEEMKADIDALTSEIVEKYAEELGITNTDTSDGEAPEVEVTESFNKYAVTTNTVVHEKFDNGRELILNFNNYAVKVELGGIYYTVSAYGYVVIK